MEKILTKTKLIEKLLKRAYYKKNQFKKMSIKMLNKKQLIDEKFIKKN